MTSLGGFPAYEVHPDRELYRIHRSAHGPLFFATTSAPGAGGRFDLPATTGRGTCYLSTSPLGAAVEVLGRFAVIAETMVRERSLTTMSPTIPLRLADLTQRRVLGEYGIAGDVSAGRDHRPSQQWAHRLAEAGFDGIYYAARHDPQFTERSVALFGTAGDQSTGEDAKRFEVSEAPIDDELLSRLVDEFSITVVPFETLAGE